MGDSVRVDFPISCPPSAKLSQAHAMLPHLGAGATVGIEVCFLFFTFCFIFIFPF